MKTQYIIPKSWTWDQAPIIGNSDVGFGDFLPEIHEKIFGYDFCELPFELGGVKRKTIEERV